MNEGWKCPVCGRGVAPTEKNCNHGELGAGVMNGSFADCGCPPSNWGCTRAYCPRVARVDPIGTGWPFDKRVYEQSNKGPFDAFSK